jgi:hypothetical protein
MQRIFSGELQNEKCKMKISIGSRQPIDYRQLVIFNVGPAGPKRPSSAFCNRLLEERSDLSPSYF